MNTSRVKRRAPQVTVKEESSLGRVGIIAAVGFVIGVAWPRLAGVSLVPEAPVEEPHHSSENEESTEAPAPIEPDVIELTPEDRLGIGPAKITSCVTEEGKKLNSCDSPDIDELVHEKLIALLGCPAATGVFGTLSLGFQVDFAAAKIKDVDSGRSTDLPKTTTKELLLCAEKEFASVDLAQVPHEHPEYQVYYLLEFRTPEVAAEQKNSVTPASGQATVQWQTALIRKEAEQDSPVQARLLSGARVVVTGRMGDWYRVKYDAKGREGWVHGGALGL